MNQVKNNLIDKINSIEDERIIKALMEIIDKINNNETKNLSDKEKELIIMGLEDYKNGKTISDESLRKDEDEWLKD